MTTGAWVVLAVGLIAFAVGVVLMSTSRRSRQPVPPREEAPAGELASVSADLADPHGDPQGLFDEPLDGVVHLGDTLVVPDPSDDSLAMVFGPAKAASRLGEVVGAVPGQLATAAVGADSLVKAGISMGEQSGMLVRLTPESTRAMKELNQIKDAGGAVMGVLRGDNAKFRHLVRFRPQQGLQLASSATSILSAVAMQAQLAAIERSIAEVGRQVTEVREALRITAAAERSAVSNVLMSTYQASTAAGVLSQSAWDQVAPMAVTVETVAEQARRELARLLDDLEAQRSTGDRRAWFTKHERSLVEALDAVASTERSRVQYSALRLWWLSASHDPLLEPYTAQMQQLVLDQEQRRVDLGARLGGLLDTAELTSRWERIHSPFDSREVQDRVHRLAATLRQRGIVPAAEPPKAQREIEGADRKQAEGARRPWRRG